MRNSWFVFSVCAVIFLACVKTPQQAGTMSETDTAMIYNPDYTPAIGAIVRFFVATDSTRTIAYQTTTDSKGHYSVSGLTKGTYNLLAYSATGLSKVTDNMLAASASLIAYQDSILVFTDTIIIRPDTLEKPGSITGIIGLQPNHDPRTATVQVLGTDIYSNVDINGRFTLSPVAKGNYNLRLVTTLPDYTPTYVTISTQGQKKDTLADTLWLLFTGIPVVTGLATTYDTVYGQVHLSWNKAVYRDFQNYLVFRDFYDSINLSTNPIAASVDTFFRDSIFKKSNSGCGEFTFSDTKEYHFKYRVCIENNSSARGETYKYANVVAASPTKAGMFKMVTNSAAFGTRSSHTSVVFDGKMWVIGGKSNENGYNYNDVWYSADGAAWTQATGNAGFSPRSLHTSLVFDNKMWVIGGNGNGIYNDVWYSADGAAWTQATGNAGFSPRSLHISLVFDNKMWVIGGIGSSRASNDVWYSADGAAWTQATGNAGFSPRHSHTSLVFDNKMWVIAGFDGGNKNDVWYSADGVTWTQATGNAGFSPRSNHTSLVFDNKMWVIAGATGVTSIATYFILSDAWYSADGVTWTEATANAANAGFPSRAYYSSLVFNNKMWVIGGYAFCGQNQYFSDVWYSK